METDSVWIYGFIRARVLRDLTCKNYHRTYSDCTEIVTSHFQNQPRFGVWQTLPLCPNHFCVEYSLTRLIYSPLNGQLSPKRSEPGKTPSLFTFSKIWVYAHFFCCCNLFVRRIFCSCSKSFQPLDKERYWILIRGQSLQKERVTWCFHFLYFTVTVHFFINRIMFDKFLRKHFLQCPSLSQGNCLKQIWTYWASHNWQAPIVQRCLFWWYHIMRRYCVLFRFPVFFFFVTCLSQKFVSGEYVFIYFVNNSVWLFVKHWQQQLKSEILCGRFLSTVPTFQDSKKIPALSFELRFLEL